MTASSNRQATGDLPGGSGEVPSRRVDSSDPVFPPSEASRWSLDNGLELIVREDESVPLVSLQIWCRTGSIHEGRWLGAGLSHLLEHMLFKGTEGRAGTEIARGVQDVGGYFNAYTSFERTVFWIDVPAEGAAAALGILCDVACCATLPEEDLEAEQEVIRREIAMGNDDPDQSLSRLVFSTAYTTHPYRFPVIGHLDIFNRVSRADLAKFYQDYYPPNNLFLVVVGDVDAGRIQRQVAEFFEGKGRRPVPASVIPSEPRQLGRRECHHEFETQLSRSSMAWHIPDFTDPDVPALDVLATVLGEGRTSRLHSRLREKEGLAHSIYSYAYTPSHGGLFAIGGVADREKRELFEDRVLEIVSEIANGEVPATEVEKARKMVTSGRLHGLTTTRGQASDLGANWMMARNLDFTRDYLEAVSRVCPDDLRRVAQRYLRDENLTKVSLNPRGSLAASSRAGRRSRSSDVQAHVLSNGLRLLVREDRRLPIVNFEACFRGGLMAEDSGAAGAMRIFGKTLVKGSRRSSAEALATRVESVGGSIESGSGRNSFGLSLDVMAPDVSVACEVFGEIVTGAAFPAREREREKEVQLAAIRAASDQPFSVASRLMRQRVFGEHCYSRDVLGTEGGIKEVDERCLESLRERYLVGNNGVVAVFGDVEAERIVDAMEEALSPLPGGELAFADKGEGARGRVFEEGSVCGHVQKSQAVVMVGFAACNLFHSHRHSLEIIDEACSDLSSRLFLRIREEMGSAYTVGSSFGNGLDPGSFIVYAGTAPDRVGEVRDALLEEMEKLARVGLDQAELERAKRTYLGKMAMHRQSSSGLAESMAIEELYGLGWNHGAEQRRIVEGLDLGEVNELAKVYFQDQPKVIVTVSAEARDHGIS